jgi:hypothetical protein
MKKSAFDSLLLKKKKMLKDIVWCEDEEYITNNYIDIDKYSIILKKPKLKENFIMLGCYKNKNIFLLANKNKSIIYISIGICDIIYWYKCKKKTIFANFYNKIIKMYANDNYNLDFSNIYKSLLLDNNIKNIFFPNKYLDNYFWGSSWKDYPFRNYKIDNDRNNNIIDRESLKQLNNIYSISCRTMYSKSIITIHNDNDILFVTVKYNSIKTEQNKLISKKNKLILPTNLPIDVVFFLCKLKLISLTKFLGNSYLINNNLNILFKLKNNLYFNSELNNSLKEVTKNLNDKIKKKKIKQFIKKILKNDSNNFINFRNTNLVNKNLINFVNNNIFTS